MNFVCISFCYVLLFIAVIPLVKSEVPSKKSALDKHRMLLSKVNEAKMSVKIEDILNSDDFQRACKNLIKVVYNQIALSKEDNLPKTMAAAAQTEEPVVSEKKERMPSAPVEDDDQKIKDAFKKFIYPSLRTKIPTQHQKQPPATTKKNADSDFIDNYLAKPDSLNALLNGNRPDNTESINLPANKIVINVKRATKSASKPAVDKPDSSVLEVFLQRLKQKLTEEEENPHKLIEITNGNSLTTPFSSGADRPIPKVKRTLLNDTARSTQFLRGEREASETEGSEEEIQ